VDYEIAIEDMIEKTSTKRAPWYLVPTNDKLFGRIAAFTILIDRLGRGVNLKPRPLDPEIAARAAQLFDLS
jgi:AMP-polyphosphate phosphotransferase